MGLFSAAVKAGIAKKVFDEARKPQNQAKIKQLIAQQQAKRGRTTR
ncbi:MAG: hypothetical protein M3P91_11805 [Actinomycetota bacterium]|nr:hypothetical protein [Actinomycetota bacterium]